jgi:threonine synthase
MGFEIAEHFGDALPDWIIYPTGGGTGLVGIWKAFNELRGIARLHPDAPMSRMVAVQSTRCAPVVKSFEAGLEHVEPVTSLGTVADGLDVPGAIMGHAILGTLRDSGGTAVAVQDAAIEDAFARYGALAIPGGYESAATLAGLRALRANGTIADDARVLLLNTGSHLIALSSRASRAAAEAMSRRL